MNRTNALLFILLLVIAGIAAATRVDFAQPNFEILPDMKYSPAWTAYEANPVFSNGRTLQSPVPGTIARGTLPLHFAATKEDAVRAGDTLQNPYLQTDIEPKTLPASIQRGAETYRIFCTACHGATGAGDGPVAKRGFPPPPSLLTGKTLQMKDGQLFHILTYGQASMPDFTGQLSVARRWDVINYVRSMQQPAVPVATTPTSDVANKNSPSSPAERPASETATPTEEPSGGELEEPTAPDTNRQDVE